MGILFANTIRDLNNGQSESSRRLSIKKMWLVLQTYPVTILPVCNLQVLQIQIVVGVQNQSMCFLKHGRLVSCMDFKWTICLLFKFWITFKIRAFWTLNHSRGDLNTDHLNTRNIWMPKLRSLDWKWSVNVLYHMYYTRPTNWVPDQYIRKQEGIHLCPFVGIQIAFKILDHLTSANHL